MSVKCKPCQRAKIEGIVTKLKQLAAASSKKDFFTPTKDDKPDKDGNYWRTIRGKKIPFRDGAHIENTIATAFGKPNPVDLKQDYLDRKEKHTEKPKETPKEKPKGDWLVKREAAKEAKWKKDFPKILDKLIKAHKITKEPKGRLFLTPDGEWIQLNFQKEHWHEVSIVAKEVIGSDAMYMKPEDYFRMGLIRAFMGGSLDDYLIQGGSKPLNSKQKKAIELAMIKHHKTADDFTFHFPDENYEKKLPSILTAVKDRDGKEGSWITANGAKIFIPDGQDKSEVVEAHFEKLKKQESWSEEEYGSMKEYRRTVKMPKVIKTLIKNNKITQNPDGNCFLTPDGKWIQLDIEGGGHEFQLNKAQDEIMKGRMHMVEYFKEGLVRLVLDDGSINIQGNKILTSTQKDRIGFELTRRGLTGDNIYTNFENENYEKKLPRLLSGKSVFLTASQKVRLRNIITLLQAKVKDGEKGRWITSKGNKIFIPEGRDAGEVLKEHFAKFKNDSKPKKPTDYLGGFGAQDVDDAKDYLLEEVAFDNDAEALQDFDETRVGKDGSESAEEDYWEATIKIAKTISRFHLELWERDLEYLLDDIKISDEDIDRFGLGDRVGAEHIGEGYENVGLYTNHMKDLLDHSAYDADEDSSYEKFSDMYDNIVNKNEALRDRIVEGEAIVSILNDENQKLYDKAETFSRGTTLDELDTYLETGEFGSDDTAYNYTAMSLSRPLANIWSGDVTIDYHAKDVREHTELVPYTLKPQPYGTSRRIKGQNYEQLQSPMSVAYSREREVRVMDTTSIYNDDGSPRIAKITFKQLGGKKTEYNKTDQTHAERIAVLKEKYGKLADKLEFKEDGASTDSKKYETLVASTDKKQIKHIMKLLNISKKEAIEEIKRWGHVRKKKKSLTASQRSRLRNIITILKGKEDEKGRWITSNGNKIFIPHGKDAGEVLKEHFAKFKKGDSKKETKKKPKKETKSKKPTVYLDPESKKTIEKHESKIREKFDKDVIESYDEQTENIKFREGADRSEYDTFVQEQKLAGEFYLTYVGSDTHDIVNITKADLKKFGIKSLEDENENDVTSYFAGMKTAFSEGYRKKSAFEKFSKMWDHVVSNSPELKKELLVAEAAMNILNQENQKAYEKAMYFSRGTNIEELETYLESESFGTDENRYNYTAMTLSRALADKWSNGFNESGITIDYYAEDIRKDSELVPYTIKPQLPGISSSIESGSKEDLKLPMSARAFHRKEK